MNPVDGIAKPTVPRFIKWFFVENYGWGYSRYETWIVVPIWSGLFFVAMIIIVAFGMSRDFVVGKLKS